MTPARLDLTIYRGIVFDPIIISAKDANGVPINLTGWNVFAKMQNGLGKLYDLAPTITDAVNGKVTISFTGNETLNFVSGSNAWDFIFQRPTGEKIGPYVSGNIDVKDVTTQ